MEIKAETREYDGPDGKYTVTRDQDGFAVTMPDGALHSHGTGFTWNDIERTYILK